MVAGSPFSYSSLEGNFFTGKGISFLFVLDSKGVFFCF